MFVISHADETQISITMLFIENIIKNTKIRKIAVLCILFLVGITSIKARPPNTPRKRNCIKSARTLLAAKGLRLAPRGIKSTPTLFGSERVKAALRGLYPQDTHTQGRSICCSHSITLFTGGARKKNTRQPKGKLHCQPRKSPPPPPKKTPNKNTHT